MAGTDRSITDLSSDKDTVLAAREHIKKVFFPALLKKYKKTKAEDMLLAFSTSFGQGQSKFGAFKIDKEGKVVFHYEDSNRPAYFGSNDDILALMQSVNDNIVSIDKKTITYKNKDSRKVDINTSATVLKSYIDDKFEDSKENTKDEDGNTVVSLQNKNKKDANLAWEFTTVFFESLKGIDADTRALMLATMNGSTNSALRLAAPVWGRSSVMPSTDLQKWTGD